MIKLMNIYNSLKYTALLLLVTGCFAALSACGKKGPLYLPPPIEAPVMTTEPVTPEKSEVSKGTDDLDKSSKKKSSEQ